MPILKVVVESQRQIFTTLKNVVLLLAFTDVGLQIGLWRAKYDLENEIIFSLVGLFTDCLAGQDGVEVVLVAVAPAIVEGVADVPARVVVEPRPLSFTRTNFWHKIAKFWLGTQSSVDLDLVFGLF